MSEETKEPEFENPWKRFFITDTSVINPRLRWGRGLVGFDGSGGPIFSSRPERKMLYKTLDSAKEAFSRIEHQVQLREVIIHLNPPQIQVMDRIVETKK